MWYNIAMLGQNLWDRKIMPLEKETIEKIFNKFNKIKHPRMGAPHDVELSNLRQSFELDIDSIAGLLSFEMRGNKSPFVKEVLNLNKLFKSKLAQLEEQNPSRDDDILYKNELKQFIISLIEIAEDLNVYLTKKYNS